VSTSEKRCFPRKNDPKTVNNGEKIMIKNCTSYFYDDSCNFILSC
jgi:hypothetical protein